MKMITLGLYSEAEFRGKPAEKELPGRKKWENILGKICFKLVLTILAAGAVYAAGSDRPERITSVVRSDVRTGKLVRSVVVSPKAVTGERIAETVVPPRAVNATGPAPSVPAPGDFTTGINAAVERIAAEHSLPPQLIHSVIKVESNYNPHAVSNKGALGMMQLIPATARRFGVSDVFNPIENIQGGARYLRYLLDLFDGSYPLALAAYNAGEAAVAHYGGIPPFLETQNYVYLVRKEWEQAKKAVGSKPVPAPVPVTNPKENGPAHIVEEVQADGTVRYVTR
jgi:soluble lytic murein transglycosylase-like protein